MDTTVMVCFIRGKKKVFNLYLFDYGGWKYMPHESIQFSHNYGYHGEFK